MEKTFTVVGTAVNADGTLKIRFANDLVARIKILDKAGCTDVKLHELPEGMTKLDAAQWLRENVDLTEAEAEVVDLKINEKTRAAKRDQAKVTISGNVANAVKSNKETDPKVAAFIEDKLDDLIAEVDES